MAGAKSSLALEDDFPAGHFLTREHLTSSSLWFIQQHIVNVYVSLGA